MRAEVQSSTQNGPVQVPRPEIADWSASMRPAMSASGPHTALLNLQALFEPLNGVSDHSVCVQIPTYLQFLPCDWRDMMLCYVSHNGLPLQRMLTFTIWWLPIECSRLDFRYLSWNVSQVDCRPIALFFWLHGIFGIYLYQMLGCYIFEDRKCIWHTRVEDWVPMPYMRSAVQQQAWRVKQKAFFRLALTLLTAFL